MSARFAIVMARSAFTAIKTQAVEHPYVLPLMGLCVAQASFGIYTIGWTLLRKSDVVLARWNHYDRNEAIDFTNPGQQKNFSFKKEKKVYIPRDKNIQELHDLIYADGEYST